jgi:DNA-binding response OmpR family regulator
MPASSTGASPLIAVMNSSRDLVTVLQDALTQDGFRTVTLVSSIVGGADSPLAFLRQHQPAAVVYSLSPPYRESWDILQEVRRQWSAGHFVITTTNIGGLRSCVGPAEALELIGKPFDLDEITGALRRVLAAGPPISDAAATSAQTAS